MTVPKELAGLDADGGNRTVLVTGRSAEVRGRAGRKRVLLANCYFDDSHRRIRRPMKLPHAMGPVVLAGVFSPHQCDLRLYNEVASGPLENEALLSWPDMLVLTGVTNAFDRMLHLAAYARTKNPRVVIVAGGPAIRAMPRLARRFFDYVCLGDVEELGEVVAEAFGRPYVAEEMTPRYDLAYWLGDFGYAETSRYCNFRCSFCALTGEGRRYQPYPLDDVRRQVRAMGKRKYLVLIDNNFYGNDRTSFLARVAVMRELWQAGHFGSWAALVTNDFFAHDEHLSLLHDAGCLALFSGVESFDTRWLRSYNKTQNTVLPQVELIQKCLTAGIMFLYGLILDATTRHVADLRRELKFITGTPEITMPAFLTLAIPLLGTPFFHDCVRQQRFLPRTKLRDMDGTTIVLKPLDPIAEVVRLVHDVQSMRGYRFRVARQAAGFVRRYGRILNATQLQAALGSAALMCVQNVATTGSPVAGLFRRRPRPRTYVTTTEPLDDVYVPAFRVASRYEEYFRPTMVTDDVGDLTETIAESGVLAPTGSPHTRLYPNFSSTHSQRRTLIWQP